MLEVLFARAEQGHTFLRMAVCGLILGALLQGRTALARRSGRLAWLGDLTVGAGLAACVFPVLLESGEGLRLYGLLGLTIGLTLYMAGIWQLTALASRWFKIHRREKQEKTTPGENNNKKHRNDSGR